MKGFNDSAFLAEDYISIIGFPKLILKGLICGNSTLL